MNTILIRLEGPLQSWGVRSRWNDRETALEPTKSGVIGLLAAAMGWGRDADDAIRSLSRAVTFGVRADLPGRLLRDYQTVVGGALSAARKIKLTASTGEPETVVSPRFYLADASFLAAIQGPEEMIATLGTALQDPVWPIFLGRKSCPPAVTPFVAREEFDSVQDALERAPRSPRAPRCPLRAVVEVEPGRGIRRQDQIDRLSRGTYLTRFSRDLLVDPPNPQDERG